MAPGSYPAGRRGRRAGAGATRDPRRPLGERTHPRGGARDGHRRLLRPHRLHRSGRRVLHRTRHPRDRGRGPLPGAGPQRRPHARREQHVHHHRVRTCRAAARHHGDLRRSARNRQRVRPRRGADDGRRGRRHADPRVRAGALLRALGARPGDSGSPHHAARSGAGADLARRHRPGRDDELPRPGRERPADARRGSRHDARRQDGGRPLREPRPGPRLSRLPGRRAGRRPREHARGRCRGARPPRPAPDAAVRFRLVRRGRADHRRDRARPGPAPVHPLHRRRACGDPGAGGAHGPRAAPRGGPRLRPAGGAADDDHQHRAALRRGARPGVPGAGALRRPGAGRRTWRSSSPAR